MIKSLLTMQKQEREDFSVPKNVQQSIPIKRIWDDGIYTYIYFSSSWLCRQATISRPSGRVCTSSQFISSSELLNCFDSGATTKITIALRRINKKDFEKEILYLLNKMV